MYTAHSNNSTQTALISTSFQGASKLVSIIYWRLYARSFCGLCFESRRASLNNYRLEYFLDIVIE